MPCDHRLASASFVPSSGGTTKTAATLLLLYHSQVTHLAGLTSCGPCLWACQQGPRVRRFPQDLYTTTTTRLPPRLVTALLLVRCTPCSSSSEGHRCLQFSLMARSDKHNNQARYLHHATHLHLVATRLLALCDLALFF